MEIVKLTSSLPDYYDTVEGCALSQDVALLLSHCFLLFRFAAEETLHVVLAKAATHRRRCLPFGKRK